MSALTETYLETAEEHVLRTFARHDATTLSLLFEESGPSATAPTSTPPTSSAWRAATARGPAGSNSCRRIKNNRLRTGQETSQPNREALAYWASGLEDVYFDGALARAAN